MSIEHTEMSQQQIEAFLQEPRFAIVGTNRAEGPPQLTPVWYLYEGGTCYVSMFVGSVKYRNLQRDPRISLCIAGAHPDARAVMIYGHADLIPEGSAPAEDSDRLQDISWRMVRRYYDSDEEAQSYLDTEAGGGASALVVVTPSRILAQDYN